ncbi:MAG TPA: hypothetical protein DEO70_05665 [Bacteroidales bacterium]|nr:MAG: hypothetical protein A2X11_16975 [Bacteroidetes bacterium GWE2_42_24]OFY25177.1 MAG: hypothetical protein A2X09_05140 [Bacteroidetes bacterium GWF2_43_11]HBZ66307.1 hypothetical protein [Bacteroidales bacterium]
MKKILFVFAMMALSLSIFAQGNPVVNVSVRETVESQTPYSIQLVVVNYQTYSVIGSAFLTLNQPVPYSVSQFPVTSINLPEPYPSNVDYCRILVRVFRSNNTIAAYQYTGVMSWDELTTSADPINIVIP